MMLCEGIILACLLRVRTAGSEDPIEVLKWVKMRLSAFWDAAANSRSALKPDLRLLSTTNGAC
jgi:hypothetical protein